ncbi:MAG: hypothetical protein ACI9EF_003344, partial [Pseudohongiellaceae bacterium]
MKRLVWLTVALLSLNSVACISGNWVRESADAPLS